VRLRSGPLGCTLLAELPALWRFLALGFAPGLATGALIDLAALWRRRWSAWIERALAGEQLVVPTRAAFSR